MKGINWSAATQETVQHLQALLRLDTTNPPGNEILAANYLAGILRREGIEPMVLEAAPGRGNVVARLKGRGDAPPLLLLGHTDVVPAEPEHWTHHPFSGDLAEGYVWGRGALDMKGTVAMQLVTFLLLKRCGTSLARDVIFAATADEETFGPYGVAWLADRYPDLIRAEYALSELGGFSMEIGHRRVYPIQTAEKGACWVTARVKGKPGHGSLPHRDNAIAHLARAIQRLDRTGLPYHLTSTTATFLDGLASALRGLPGFEIRLLKHSLTSRWVLERLIRDEGQARLFRAMLYNTATPTGLSAGVKTNVIPSVAEVTLDGRTLPGFSAEKFLAELRAVLGEDLEYEVIKEAPPLETRHDTRLFETMRRVLLRHDPEAVVLPYMVSGATDAKHLAKLNIPCYGFSPLRVASSERFIDLFHGHDERVAVDALAFGLRVLFEVVHDFCATPD